MTTSTLRHPALLVTDLAVSYGPTQILHRLDLELPRAPSSR